MPSATRSATGLQKDPSISAGGSFLFALAARGCTWVPLPGWSTWAGRASAANFPGKIWAVLGVFAFIFALDSLNSFAMLLPGSPSVYLTTNLIRIFAGTGMGIIIPVVLWPVFHQTVWEDFEPRPILAGWKELGIVLLFAVGLDLFILSGVPFLVLPAAFISAGTVLAILTQVYTVVWTMLQRNENKYRIWSEIWVLLLLGFITALGQIAFMDILRYNMTGTWSGFIPQ